MPYGYGNRYNFSSPGAAATDALTQELARREVMKRQRLLDEITRANTESQIADREMNRSIQQDALESVRQQREAQALERIFEDMPEGQEIDTPTFERAKKGGYGGMFEERAATADLVDLEGKPIKGSPAKIVSKGGSKWQATRKANEEKATLEREKAAERARQDAERAADRREAQEDRQSFQAGQNALARAITQQGMDLRTEAANDKKAEAARAQDAKREAALGHAESMRRAIGDLMELDKAGAPVLDDAKQPKLKPGAAQMVGKSRWFDLNAPGIPGVLAEMYPGSQAATSRAALQQLVGQRVIELMREMKSQSKTGATGFGALSEKELALLEASSARLQTAQSDEAFAKELTYINSLVDKIYQNAPAAAAPASPTAAPGKKTAAQLIEQYRRQ